MRYRLGNRWLDERLRRRREPQLRPSVRVSACGLRSRPGRGSGASRARSRRSARRSLRCGRIPRARPPPRQLKRLGLNAAGDRDENDRSDPMHRSPCASVFRSETWRGRMAVYALPISRFAGDARAPLATGWLVLGLAALVASGSSPSCSCWRARRSCSTLFPVADFFRVALVVHVDLSVLVWFLALRRRAVESQQHAAASRRSAGRRWRSARSARVADERRAVPRARRRRS